MVDIYSSVDVINEAKAIIQRPGDITIRIALQTIECGIFILHYTSDGGRSLILSSPPKDLLRSHHVTSTRPPSNWGHPGPGITPLKSNFAAQG